MNKTSSLQKQKGLELDGVFSAKHPLTALLKKLPLVQGAVAVRRIKEKDNLSAKIFIQKTLLSRGGVGFDKLYYDKELGDIYHSYQCEDSFFWVLMDKNELIGTIGLRKNPSNGRGELTKFYVHENANKYASSLLSVAMSMAKKTKCSSVSIPVGLRDQNTKQLLSQASFTEDRVGNQIRMIYKF